MRRDRRRIAIGIATTMVVLIITAAALVWVWRTGLWSPLKWAEYRVALREMAPVEFYGQVVDESNRPVTDATVVARLFVADWTYLISTDRRRGMGKYVPLTLISDADGHFAVTGRQASCLLIDSIEKTGYPSLTVKKGFYYSQGQPSPHTDNPNAPVVFRLRRVGEGQDEFTRAPSKGRAKHAAIRPTPATALPSTAPDRWDEILHGPPRPAQSAANHEPR